MNTRHHLVAAPDKFRGTASAAEVAAAAAAGAARSGWTAREVPMADGGEGLLDVVGGMPRRTDVHGPSGTPVTAEWRLLPRASGDLAVIESAEAVGLALVDGSDPEAAVLASTRGVGELVMAARDAGASTIVVGCGGSGTTDGGWGAVSAVGGPAALAGVSLVVASDVRTRFLDAPRIFGPQKGASPEQVRLLADRLRQVAARYRRELGIDVTDLEGAGAAGGLAGGLAALGGRVTRGFDVAARLAGLPASLGEADLVVTGEGRLDATSWEGKVVGGVVDLVGGRVPVLCIAGSVDAGARHRVPSDVEIVDLVERAGPRRARQDTVRLVEEVVAERLADA